MYSTRLLKLTKTAIKISNRSVEYIVIIAKILFRAKQIQTAGDFEPRLGQPRGASARAERRGFVRGKPMGGTSCRPPIRRSKIGKSNCGVYLRLCSNLLYQKFLNCGSSPPKADGRRDYLFLLGRLGRRGSREGMPSRPRLKNFRRLQENTKN